MDLSTYSLAADANSTLSAPVDVPITDQTTGAVLQDVGGIDLTGLAMPPLNINYPSTTDNPWSGLDSLGSSVANVGSQIFQAAGNLIAAQVNNAALLTATGRRGIPQNKVPVANPNVWKTYLAVGGAIIGVVAIIWAVRSRG